MTDTSLREQAILNRAFDDVNDRLNVGASILSGFGLSSYDYIGVTYNSTTDVYVFKTGGSGGTTVGTVTLTYSDSTKAQLDSVTKV